MIRLDGVLRVKKILQSRNGPFAVGTLSTAIGTFKVKDQLLDAFDEGEYHVTAWIAEVFLGQYTTGTGTSITEIRARLQDLQVRSEAASPQDSEEVAEPDPLDEPPPAPRRPAIHARMPPAGATPSPSPAPTARPTTRGWIQPPPASPAAAAPASAAPVEPPGAEGPDLSAFSDDLAVLIRERKPVKLDPTIDRVNYREQTRQLRQNLGYTFRATEQTFYPA